MFGLQVTLWQLFIYLESEQTEQEVNDLFQRHLIRSPIKDCQNVSGECFGFYLPPLHLLNATVLTGFYNVGGFITNLPSRNDKLTPTQLDGGN